VIAYIEDIRELFLLSDFNSRTGREINNKIMGPYGEERVNDKYSVRTSTSATIITIRNEFFKHKQIHKYMCI